MPIYTKLVTLLGPQITGLSDHHCVCGHGMHVELDDYLVWVSERVSSYTCYLKVSINFENIFFIPHLSS